jgi:hypothetical protein
MEHIKHITSGGYWQDEQNDWVKAGLGICMMICDHTIIKRHLGWVDTSPGEKGESSSLQT